MTELPQRTLGRQLGIDEVYGEVRPQDKSEQVARVNREGRRVAMASGGINDAPALAAADIAMSIGTGTDVAMALGDVTLIEAI